MDNQQGLIVQNINSAQYYVAVWIGGGLGKKGYMYMYGGFP